MMPAILAKRSSLFPSIKYLAKRRVCVTRLGTVKKKTRNKKLSCPLIVVTVFHFSIRIEGNQKCMFYLYTRHDAVSCHELLNSSS